MVTTVNKFMWGVRVEGLPAASWEATCVFEKTKLGSWCARAWVQCLRAFQPPCVFVAVGGAVGVETRYVQNKNTHGLPGFRVPNSLAMVIFDVANIHLSFLALFGAIC